MDHTALDAAVAAAVVIIVIVAGIRACAIEALHSFLRRRNLGTRTGAHG